MFLSLFAFKANAQVPSPAAPQQRPVMLTGGTAHIGNGEVVENATVIFENGKISSVAAGGTAQDTAGYQVVDVKDKHVYPGFILPNTDLGLVEIGAVRATVDNQETGELNPNVRSLISYNTDSELIPTMRFNGILLAQVVPTGGMVPGSSSVVQLDAWNWEDAAVKADDAIHMHWPQRFNLNFDYTTYTVNREPNKQYIEEVRKLETLFSDAMAYNADDDSRVDNLKLKAMQGLFDGTQALHIHGGGAREIIESIRFAKQLGIKKIVLVSGTEASMVKDFLKENDIPVIITNLHELPDMAGDDVDLYYKLPYLLSEAGLLVGMGYARDMIASARNLAFLAGTAAAYGLDKEKALQIITANNAKILGIDDQAGTLEKGKHATLFVSDGDALDMRGNIIDMAFIDGRKITLDAMQQRLYEKYKEKYSAEGK